MSAPWGKVGASDNEDKSGRGVEFSCKWIFFPEWFLQGRREHLKAILSSFFWVKVKRQTRNMYSMHVFFKDFLFLDSFCSFLIVFQLRIRTDRVRDSETKSGQALTWEGGVESWQKYALWITPN